MQVGFQAAVDHLHDLIGIRLLGKFLQKRQVGFVCESRRQTKFPQRSQVPEIASWGWVVQFIRAHGKPGPVSDLKALYARLDPEKETVVYCQSGVRAAETAAVLSELGFKNVKVYDSSWLGYGNTLDAPAEDAVFLNVGALNSRLGAMQNRIDALEKELAAAKSAK